MQYFQFVAASAITGIALPNARVSVYYTGTQTPATLYDIDGEAITNPLTALNSGSVGFKVKNGVYDIQVDSSDGLYSAPLWKSVQIYDVDDLGTGLINRGNYSPSQTYSANNSVIYSDEKFYIPFGYVGTITNVTPPTSPWVKDNFTLGTIPDRLEAVENELITPLSVTAAVSPATAEVGSTQTVTVSGTVSRTPDTLSINQGIGSQTPGTSYSATKTGVTSNTTFTVTAVSGLISRTAQASVGFKRKRYWGGTSKADGTALTRAEILAAEAAGRWEWVDGRAMGQKSFTLSDEYGWVAEPASVGVSPLFLFDGVAAVEAPAPDTFSSFENTSGGVADYYVYRTSVKYTGTYGIAKP